MAATTAMRSLQAAAASFLAGSGAVLLVAYAPVGSLAALHSWEQPAREALAESSTASLPYVHSDKEKTRGTGLYSYLSTRLISDGVETAPRARREPDPTGVGTSMRTPPLPENTGGDTRRGVDGHLGEGANWQCKCFG